MSTDQYFLIIPASGIGTRMNVEQPKQYLKLENGLSVLDQTLKTMLSIEKIKGFVVAIAENDTQFCRSIFANHNKLLATAIGGKERFHSVISALNALHPFAQNNDWVLVHDAARPCVKADEVENLIRQLKGHSVGGLLSTKVIDTIKKSHGNIVKTTLDRSELWQAQTPQMYRFGVLSKALNKALNDNLNITDEASSVEHLGLDSILVPSSKSNLKITTPEDLELANFYLNNTMTKTGLGQDSHAFDDEKNNKPLMLGGIEFDYPQGLKGNSDADVILHSITNAVSSVTGNNILGAKADKLCQQGVTNSAEYLKLALNDLGNWKIEHIAITVECLVPKISPKIKALKSSIAKLTNIKTRNIGITATTGEGLTAFGKGKGIQVFSIISFSRV